MSSASEGASGQASSPVLTSRLLDGLNHRVLVGNTLAFSEQICLLIKKETSLVTPNIRCVPLPRLPHPFWASMHLPSIFLFISEIKIMCFCGFEEMRYGRTNGRTDGHRDQRTHRPMDQWTERPSYRDARMHCQLAQMMSTPQ